MYIDCDDFIIRCITASDAEEYLAIFSHPDVARFDDYTPINRDDLPVEMERIAGYRPDSIFREIAVARKEDNLMMGVLTIERKRGRAYLGYHFNPVYQGRGVASRSVIALLASLSEQERLRFRLLSHPDNRASIALAKRAGFEIYGRRVKNGVAELLFRFEPEIWNASQGGDLCNSPERSISIC